MKKDDAFKKWCPMVRVHVAGITEYTNRHAHVTHTETCCIADDCAVWVWDWKDDGNKKTWEGHCGLARW